MSVKSSKSSKPLNLARYDIDVLAVYSSVDETPVPLDNAMSKIQQLITSKTGTIKRQIRKCILLIKSEINGSYTVTIKANNNKQILESFSINSIGKPQVGQLSTQSLVFLPVLNKDRKSELFVFHPNTGTAQEIVIRLVKLMQLRENVDPPTLISPTPPKSEQGEMINLVINDYDHVDHVVQEVNHTNKENGDREDNQSDYSLSSTFFNNWYAKVENMVSMTPNSLYQSSDYGSSISDDLYLLNHHLREIRAFMNNLYAIMHKVYIESNIRNDRIELVANLPPKGSFVEIVHKIKSSLNMASNHESIITNPTAKDIVNQLILILKILCDATFDKTTKIPDLIMGIRDPFINHTTVKFLTENLTSTNMDFWVSLGENYGYVELVDLKPIGLHRITIDEFQIKRDLLSTNHEESSARSQTASPNRMFEKKPPLYYVRNERDREHENKYYRHYSSDVDILSADPFPKKKMLLSQPQLSYSEPLRNAPLFNDDIVYHSYPREYDTDRYVSHLPDPSIKKKWVTSSHHNGDIHPTGKCWNDKQCRFIDAVRLRNGRIVKVTRDRSAQNHREIPVSCNEVLELLSDYGDMLSVKNAFGEIGYCPSSIVEHIAI